MEELNVSQALEGQSLGKQISWATQALAAMERNEGASGETINLRGQIDLCKLAEDWREQGRTV